MDTKQIEYILKIAEEKNITRAAAKLFLTQSALNQQLLKLEKELGCKLFYRSRTDWHPTEAGLVYLENAREMLRIKRETYNKIHDIEKTKSGHLSIGFTPGRGITMFSNVYPLFHREYPNIVVEPMELSVHRQQQLISQGALDIGFMTLQDKDMTADSYITLMDEEIFLAVPSLHPVCRQTARNGAKTATLDIRKLRYEPFVLMYRESTIRSMVDSIFKEADIIPDVLFETSSTEAILTMIKNNLCCGLIPGYYARKHPEGVTFFHLPSRPTWHMAACCNKDNYLSRGARRFIELATDYWSPKGA